MKLEFDYDTQLHEALEEISAALSELGVEAEMLTAGDDDSTSVFFEMKLKTPCNDD